MIRNRQESMTVKEKAVARQALAEAVAKAGGTQAALAKALKCSRANVNQFMASGSVSLLMAKRIEDKLGIPRSRTMPNVYGG